MQKPDQPIPQKTMISRFARARRESFNTFSKTLIPLVGNTTISKIISVGCGPAVEAAALLGLFKGSSYRGIDSKHSEILLAQRFNADIAPERFGLLEADARLAESYKGGPFDLVVIKSPKTGSGKLVDPAWRTIFEASANALSPTGLLFVSTMAPKELDKSKEYLAENNLEVISELHDVNPANSGFVYPEVDILIARKKP